MDLRGARGLCWAMTFALNASTAGCAAVLGVTDVIPGDDGAAGDAGGPGADDASGPGVDDSGGGLVRGDVDSGGSTGAGGEMAAETGPSDVSDGSFTIECMSRADCSDGQICCGSFSPPGSFCMNACMAGVQICATATECPLGDACSTFALVTSVKTCVVASDH